MGNGVSRSRDRPPKDADFKVTVKTGDLKGAGTDANVNIRLYDGTGLASRDKILDCRWRDDFESGATDVFYLRDDMKELARINRIEIWRDNSGIGSSWYCEWVKVSHLHQDVDDSMFPVHRWIHERPVAIIEFDCVLPQHDRSRLPQREAELATKRKAYEHFEHAPMIPPHVRKLMVKL